MNYIKNYLKLAKKGNSNYYVLGNMSFDMDSIIGSILTSIYFYNNNKIIFIPVINSSKEKMKFKFEIINYLKKFNIFLDDLFFINEVELNKKESNIILFDHNKLINYQYDLKNKVIGIIDHHINLKDFDNYNEFMFYKIKFSGSATLLILEELLKIDCKEKEIYDFCLSPILLDTYNFDFNRKNIIWDDKDYEIFNSIKNQLNKSNEYYELVYNNLVKDMLDIDNNLLIGIENLFYKDYKLYNINKNKIGISNLSLDFEEFLDKIDKKDLFDKYKNFKKINNLDCYIIVSNYNYNKTKKYIYFFNEDKIANWLIKNLNIELKLIKSDINNINIYFTNSLELNRKLLEQILNFILINN